MTPLLWIAVGFLIGIGASIGYSAWRSRSEEQEPVDCRAQLEAEFAERIAAEATSPLQSIAIGIGRELADLATAVQGNAQLLCEVLGEPELVAGRCERLWNGCDRLRLLTEKILTFAREEQLEREPVDVRLFLDRVRREIESIYGGLLRVHVATAPFLPPALAHVRGLRNSILFLIETLLELEPRTASLQIAAYADVTEDDGTSISIEICAEAAECDRPVRAAKEALQLGYIAAQRSLEAQGGELAVQQVAGLSATCLITLDAEVDGDQVHPTQTFADEQAHEFGGVLVLERDPTIRSVIAAEVERRGRKIIACADGSSARALLAATPERIELVIVESDAPHEGGIPVALHALSLNPDVQVLILHGVGSAIEEIDSDAITILSKPFGALELRAALAATLAPDEPQPELRGDSGAPHS